MAAPAWFPAVPDTYTGNGIGFIHGVQYWVNPGATPQSIDDDFRAMAQEDCINAARIAFWALFPPYRDPDWKLADACFDSALRYKIKLNPVLPQIPGWVDGSADDPNIRQKYRDYIHKIVAHFKDKPALAMWTVDIEPSRSYKANPGPVTLALYRTWLRTRYSSPAEFSLRNEGLSQDSAYPVNSRSKGPWNNFAGFDDWITFTAFALAQQTLFIAQSVHEIDPVHPTSCTPPDVLHNQLIENGRNMWWLADTVDCPSMQLHAHWHLEIADMPADVLCAQACSVRKVCNSARGRPCYTGELLAGYDLGESPRLYSPTAPELLCSELVHLAEGSQGAFYWIWNPLREGPNAGAWSIREPDGSRGQKSILAADFGKMVQRYGDLFCKFKPADTRVAIFDSADAAIYLARRSEYHVMSEWYVKNQYGFYKALRKVGIGCDFTDETGLTSDAVNHYDCVYVPFSMVMQPEIAMALKNYVARGGTIIVDCFTAFTPYWHAPYPVMPGLGLDEVLGIRALTPELAGDGITDVKKITNEEYFDRLSTASKSGGYKPLYDRSGNRSDLVAMKFIQPVRPTTASILLNDAKGRPICTVNNFGKGHAIWTGTLLGISCRDADTPFARYEALANLLKPYIHNTTWSLRAPENSIIIRRLTDGNDSIFVLINESDRRAGFTLDAGRRSSFTELLPSSTGVWRTSMFSKSKISGTLQPLQGSVIYCQNK
jgi:hypothetical protein